MNQKSIKIVILSLLILVIGVSNSYAQKYKSSIGVGLGTDISVDFKHFLSKNSAIEIQGAYNILREGVALSVVYQYHVPIVNDFAFYGGAGVTVGALDIHQGMNSTTFAVGVAPTVGFEYAFNKAPIALAIDYKPNIYFTTASQWDLVSLKVRFTW